MMVFAVLALAGLMALWLSPWASSAPDGLEYTLERIGVTVAEAGPPPTAILPDYKTPGVGAARWSTGIAGLLGVSMVFAVGFLVEYRRRR
jgi:hypothetical protein